MTTPERRLELATRLQALVTALATEITPASAIDVLLEQAVGALGADAGAVGLLDDSGENVRLAGSIGYSEAGLAGWDRFPMRVPLPMSDAIRTNEPVWTTTARQLQERYPALAGAQVRFDALATIPLTVEGKPFGALSMSFRNAREFDADERSFLQSAAQQAAYALERARLFAAEQIASERLAFLAEAGELLSGSLEPETTLRRLAELSVRRISDWCGVELIDETGTLRNVAVAHVDPEQVRLAQELRTRYPIDPASDTGVPHVVRTGEPELYEDVTDEMLVAAAIDEEHLRLIRALGMTSVMIVPLVVRGEVLGAISFVGTDPEQRFGPADLNLAEELARRAAVGIKNAVLYRREHDAAVALQRSLLPQSLPEVEGLEFAALYEPAGPGLEVGGDWYEVAAVEDGTVGVTIGDVAGRGIAAASVMGRVRPGLRAYVVDGYRPVEAIRRLDRLMKESDRPQMTTVLHLHYDPATGQAEYVRAGHPPGLLRLPDGTVRDLDGEGTPPLGILDDLTYRAHGVEIPPGSLLLLYTDGLIERPGESLDVGLSRLREALPKAPASAAGCLEWLAAEFRASEIADDVAMLAMVVSR